MPERISLFLADEAATEQLGADLALALRPGDLLALNGDLGTGKTTLSRALIRSMADDPALEVPSPTYTLVQSYETRVPVHHFDLYRLGDPEELEELGLSEALQGGAALIEWPERAKMPVTAINIGLEHEGEGRRVTITGEGVAMDRIRRSLAIREFLDRNGWGAAARHYLLGDASARAYETVHLPDRAPRIVMNAPRLVLGPAVRDGKPYAEIAHTAQSVSAFVAIDHALHEAGLTVPEIHGADLEQGFLLVEHLGSGTFLDAGRPVQERYEAAAALLAHIHKQDWPRDIAAGDARHRIPDFDRPAMQIEVSLLPDWYLPYMTGQDATPDLRAEFEALWDEALDAIADAPTSLLLRDYHSPNIIWREERAGFDRLGLIDFQDAMIGPTAYDVASLAMDARVTIAPDLEAAIVDAYLAASGADRATFQHAYAVMAAHRNSKILGGFVRLDRRDGKPIYLKHLPRIRDYTRRALAHPALARLRAFYERNNLLTEARQ